MRIFQIILLLLIIAVGALYAGYRYGPESIQNSFESVFESLGIDRWMKSISGQPAEPPKDELMLKSETFYIWKDLEGNDHYVTSLEDIPPQFRENVRRIDSTNIPAQFELMDEKQQADMLNKMQHAPVPEQFKDAQHKILIYTYEGNKELDETIAYFDKFNMPYELRDVVKDPKNAVELKLKLGLDLNKKYDNINFPVIEIDGQIIERIVNGTDKKGKVTSTSLNTAKINKIFGLRSTYE
jgi:hypothetical protein